MQSTLVHLVRHGESAGNVDPTLPRSDDPPLTARGQAQAHEAATTIARLGVVAVYSSPVRRARQTAERIAAAVGLPITLVPALGEVDMGSLSTATHPDQRSERDAIFSAWLAGDRRRSFPGGEDFGAVLRRVSAALEHACARGHAVAVVTHRMPIAAALSLCAPLDPSRPVGPCANGSITTLQRDGAGGWALPAGVDG